MYGTCRYKRFQDSPPPQKKQVKKSFPKFQMGLRFVLTNRYQTIQTKDIRKQATNTHTPFHGHLVDLIFCHWVHSCGYSFCKNRQLERCCLESPSGVWQDVQFVPQMNCTSPLRVEGRCLKYFGVSTLFFYRDVWRGHIKQTVALSNTPSQAKRQNLQLNQLRCGLLR